MTTVNIYLTFNGNCREAFDFYQKAFKVSADHMSTFGEIPASDDAPPIPEADKDKIMHVSMPISKETVLMGSDSSSAFGPTPTAGNNFSISINADTKEEGERLFNALSDGGNVTMPMNETFWNAYFGMFTDRFGINWMVNVELEQ